MEMNEMERGQHGLKARTNADIFYIKVRVRPFFPHRPRSNSFITA